MPAYYEFRSVEMDRVGCGKRKCAPVKIFDDLIPFGITLQLTNSDLLFFFRVLKPPGGGSSDIFGTADLNKPAAGTKSNHSDHFGSGSGFGGDLSDLGVKASSVDSNDGASTPSQTSTSNGSPNNSEPNTPRSGKQLEKYERILSSVFCFLLCCIHTFFASTN